MVIIQQVNQLITEGFCWCKVLLLSFLQARCPSCRPTNSAKGSCPEQHLGRCCCLSTDHSSLVSSVIIKKNTHTHTHLTALFPGPPRRAGTRKVKPIWILLKQETVSGSGISWVVCKSAPRSKLAKFFTGRMPFLPLNQQRQSTEGTLLGRKQT